MVRNSTRGSDGDVGREEELGRQPRVGGGHSTASIKLAEPLVRRAEGPSSNGSQNWANGRSGNEVRIVSSKGGTNVGAKPVPRGSSSFMGSNRFDASKKNPDVSKPVVYTFRERSTDPSRLSSIKTIKDHNGAGPIDNVFKILSNSNRNNHGEIISKTSKAALVEDRVSVALDYCTSNRLNNPPSSKPSQGSSMANRNSTRATRGTSQLHRNNTGDIAKEQQRQQCPGLALCCNPKENNTVNKQENCESDQPISRHVKGPTKTDLQVVDGEFSSSQQPSDESQTKFTPPQPPQEVRGRSPSQDYVLQEWMHGPSSPTGQLVNVSDRPSLCMSVRGNEACIGSSDHALYIVDCEKCTLKRSLYGKQYGHTEWVTCCDYLKDGRILSGGMDGKLCLWDKNGIRTIDLLGHMASISAVRSGAEGSLAISASYDKTLMLWNVNRSQTKNAACLKGHKAPVLGFCLSSQGAIVSGSRDGDVILWDTAHATPLLHVSSAHKGHVTAVECLEDTKNKTWEECREMYLTGGQDGILRAWDFRTRGPVHSAVLHRNAVTKGAVNSIAVSYTACGSGPIVVTAGADNSMKVLEPRMGFKALHTICTHRDFIYSLYVAGPLVWSGSGDGSLLVHELLTGQCLYGLGADSKGAVRCISLAGPDRLVVAGDDGNVMIYKVSSCDSKTILPTEHFQS